MKKILMVLGIFIMSFLIGNGIGYISDCVFAAGSKTVSSSKEWGLGFGESGSRPRGDVSEEELEKYNAYYISPSNEKKVYLTFDCGYENGHTTGILDALKKHNAPATFFVVGHYLETEPELIQRMVNEGHAVGNHTYNHPDMTGVSNEKAKEELTRNAEKFKEITGRDMDMYFRPPKGAYDNTMFSRVQNLGYSTILWSLAYNDWDTKKQPAKDEAIRILNKRVHPGAVVLLHNTSATNEAILDELLTGWENMGYTFAPLSDFVGTKKE